MAALAAAQGDIDVAIAAALLANPDADPRKMIPWRAACRPGTRPQSRARWLPSVTATTRPPAPPLRGHQARLDALAEAGYHRLDDQLHAAIDIAGDDHRTRLRAVATAYTRFATHEDAFLKLMYAVKSARTPQRRWTPCPAAC